MREFIILIIEMFGLAAIASFFLTIVNYYFDWNLGVYGVSPGNDPYIGIYFLIIGLIFCGLGWFLNKKYPTEMPSEK